LLTVRHLQELNIPLSVNVGTPHHTAYGSSRAGLSNCGTRTTSGTPAKLFSGTSTWQEKNQRIKTKKNTLSINAVT
jgi:hypothetical protein